MLRRWQREPRVAGSCDPRVNPSCDDSRELPDDGRLRLLSFNIQVGISTERYRHYLTRGWQHLLPHAGRATNLKRIGELLADYDLVALQEADGGSLRSGYVNQVEHLAQLGRSPTGTSSSTATSGVSPSTATACSAAGGRPCWKIIRCPVRRDAARSSCVLAKAPTRWW